MSCRVLELGCAGAGNLIPLAQILPGVAIRGVDLSPRQIEAATSHGRGGRRDELEFHARSVTDIGEDFGRFDYILCHGVYSWVPDDVKAAILRVCHRSPRAEGRRLRQLQHLPRLARPRAWCGR